MPVRAATLELEQSTSRRIRIRTVHGAFQEKTCILGSLYYFDFDVFFKIELYIYLT